MDNHTESCLIIVTGSQHTLISLLKKYFAKQTADVRQT